MSVHSRVALTPGAQCKSDEPFVKLGTGFDLIADWLKSADLQKKYGDDLSNAGLGDPIEKLRQCVSIGATHRLLSDKSRSNCSHERHDGNKDNPRGSTHNDKGKFSRHPFSVFAPPELTPPHTPSQDAGTGNHDPVAAGNRADNCDIAVTQLDGSTAHLKRLVCEAKDLLLIKNTEIAACLADTHTIRILTDDTRNNDTAGPFISRDELIRIVEHTTQHISNSAKAPVWAPPSKELVLYNHRNGCPGPTYSSSTLFLPRASQPMTCPTATPNFEPVSLSGMGPSLGDGLLAIAYKAFMSTVIASQGISKHGAVLAPFPACSTMTPHQSANMHQSSFDAVGVGNVTFGSCSAHWESPTVTSTAPKRLGFRKSTVPSSLPGVNFWHVPIQIRPNKVIPFCHMDRHLKRRYLDYKLMGLRMADAVLRTSPEFMDTACEPIHVFIDLSNIVIGFQDSMKASRGSMKNRRCRPPFDFFNFHTILMRGRKSAKRIVSGSVPNSAASTWPAHMEQARGLGYDMCITQRIVKHHGSNNSGSSSSGGETRAVLSFPKNGEQCVDELLHLKMLQSAVDFQRPATAVVATGDAAAAEFSDGFMEQVIRLLKKGWLVELYCWSQSSSSAWKNAGFREKWGERFKLFELDPYAEELHAH